MAYMAIETKYLGPTNYRGSRIKATAREPLEGSSAAMWSGVQRLRYYRPTQGRDPARLCVGDRPPVTPTLADAWEMTPRRGPA
jgi:hypothetical protein